MTSKKCKHCGSTLKHEGLTFCNKSCSATYNNKARGPRSEESKKKTSDALTGKTTCRKGTIIIEGKHVFACHVSFCVICGKSIPNKKQKTCSLDCKGDRISNKNKGNTGGSTKQFIQYQDSFGNYCYLDSTWELKTANELDNAGVRWIRPNSFHLQDGRRYTPDFYLVDFDVYLDPKAFRSGHHGTVSKINLFEKQYNTVCFIITAYKDLNWPHIYSLLESIDTN